MRFRLLSGGPEHALSAGLEIGLAGGGKLVGGVAVVPGTGAFGDGTGGGPAKVGVVRRALETPVDLRALEAGVEDEIEDDVLVRAARRGCSLFDEDGEPRGGSMPVGSLDGVDELAVCRDAFGLRLAY